jgi:imidazolonepropionase-like amidohydrolase
MDATAYLITNVTVIDGTGGEPLRGGAVVVEGERITWVGPATLAPAFEPRSILDGGGCTLLPGLINCHVHLCNDGVADLFQQVRDDSITIATIRGVLNAELALRAGITTVRDCGAANDIVVELAKAIDRGMIAGPTIKAAGRVITMTGGHGHFIGREADGVDGVRKATRAEIKGGAHFIKAMATGGVLTPGVDPTQTAFQIEELEAVAQEAHKAGRRTACHAIGNAGIKNALRAGIDSIEHGFYLDDEAIELFLKNRAFLVPTLIAVEQIVKNGEARGIPDWVVRKAAAEGEHHQASFAAAVKSGMKIAAGTDAGTPFNPHGDLNLELALMVEYGLDPMQALVAATRNAAENLAILDSVGTIEVGKMADLMMVRGDPLQDITAMQQVAFVAKHGRVYRDDLSAAPALASALAPGH